MFIYLFFAYLFEVCQNIDINLKILELFWVVFFFKFGFPYFKVTLLTSGSIFWDQSLTTCCYLCVFSEPSSASGVFSPFLQSFSIFIVRRANLGILLLWMETRLFVSRCHASESRDWPMHMTRCHHLAVILQVLFWESYTLLKRHKQIKVRYIFWSYQCELANRKH